MQNSIISEGNTTNEAIENGLKKLGVSKKDVEIKVLEEEKKSFFDILAPRIVKVELTLKGNKPENRKEIIIDKAEVDKAIENTKKFLDEFIKNFSGIEYEIEEKDNSIFIKITGENASELIGYRGEAIESLQVIVASIINKETTQRIRVIIDILDYKEKRKKTLEDLARRIEKTVIKSGRPYKLEPMNAYERKIIHTALQESKYVTTNSVGEEPHRRIIIRKK